MGKSHETANEEEMDATMQTMSSIDTTYRRLTYPLCL